VRTLAKPLSESWKKLPRNISQLTASQARWQSAYGATKSATRKRVVGYFEIGLLKITWELPPLPQLVTASQPSAPNVFSINMISGLGSRLDTYRSINSIRYSHWVICAALSALRLVRTPGGPPRQSRPRADLRRRPVSELLWNDYRFHSDALAILVSGKSTGFLFLALRLRLFHRCIRPELGV
jgi:hypothetical protein